MCLSTYSSLGASQRKQKCCSQQAVYLLYLILNHEVLIHHIRILTATGSQNDGLGLRQCSILNTLSISIYHTHFPTIRKSEDGTTSSLSRNTLKQCFHLMTYQCDKSCIVNSGIICAFVHLSFVHLSFVHLGNKNEKTNKSNKTLFEWTQLFAN